MPSEPEYLNLAVYLNICDHHQRCEVNTWFRGFFQNKHIRIREPLNDCGLLLFIMLGLFYPLTCDVRCMGRSRKHERCQNKIDVHSLCDGMQRLWDIARSSELQGKTLLCALHDVCKHFLCEGQHRKEVNGRVIFAERLALEWYTIIEQFREWCAAQ